MAPQLTPPPYNLHSHLVHDQLHLHQVLQGLLDQRGHRSAVASSGYWCFSVAVDFRCHTDYHEHQNCVVGECYVLVRFAQNEASVNERPERQRVKKPKLYLTVINLNIIL